MLIMKNKRNKEKSSEILINLGKRIKKLRLDKNWTQEKFAEMAKINDKEVTHIEAGKRNITIETLTKIANSFDVKPYKLLLEED